MAYCNHEVYENLETELYEPTSKKRSRFNFIANWFHKRRQEIVKEWINKNSKTGDTIVDFGCGTCTWNTNCLPVVGVDINLDMLNYAKQKGRLTKIVKADLKNTDLNKDFADIIIIGDVLEHLKDYNSVLKEARRVLKPNGILFVSVPYDTFLSLWWPLFNTYCIFKGYILGCEYHKAFTGHINHFSPKKIKKTIENNGFKVKYQFNNKRFTIYTIAQTD